MYPRSFYYGDFLLETMLWQNGVLQHESLHYSRIQVGAQVLAMQFPEAFTVEKFSQMVRSEIERFRFFQTEKSLAIRVRVCLYRKAGGFYRPDSNETDWHVDVFPFEPKAQDQPIRVGIYEEQKKAVGPLSNLKTGNALIYVMASIYATQQGWDDALILNQHGNICEASASNVFWVKDAQWFTVPLSEGCVAGVMRQVVMREWLVIEAPCTITQLLKADAIYLTNAIAGCRRVELVRG